jgi:PKD repeat protein
MKRFVLLTVLILAICRLPAQNGWRQGEMEVNVYLRSIDDVRLFRSLHLDGEGATPDGSVLRVFVTHSELSTLASTGIDYKVVISDLNQHSRQILGDGSVMGYYNFFTITALADSLATAFPSICRKILIGTSASGRPLAVLKISDNVNVNENEPEILFEGGIHGDEIMGPEVVIRFARDLCTGYGSNTTYTALINSREIWLYYIVNPDGYVGMSRYNGNGVDINRDFGYMWGGEGFSSGAYSQPEAKAIRGLLFDHNPVVFTDYHGGTEVIAYPWSYKTDASADVTHINNLASVYSNTSGYPSLGFGQGYNIMYQILGSTKDNQYGCLGQVGWSIEITSQKQPPPAQIGLYYGYNLPAVTEMVTRAGYGVEGLVTDSVSGIPLKATIWVDGFFPVYTDPQVGDYHKYVLPGIHTVKVKASGYKTKTVTGVSVPATGSAVTNFQLAPDPGRYAYRAISMQIPGYPSSGSYPDESYTPGIIGAPDSATYSLGKSGWIVIDMGDTIFDGTGNDFKVWESGGTPEGYTVYAGPSMDGPWTSLGMATGSHSFDLATAAVLKVRYLKFVDDGDGSVSMPDAGFDLDAVEFLTVPLIVDFTANLNTPCVGTAVNFADNSSGSPTSWTWTFPGGTPGTSNLQNPTNILYSNPGIYDVSLTIGNGTSTASLTKTAFISVQDLPPVPSLPSGPTVVCANDTSAYTTAGTPTATQFSWSLWPPDAGMVTGAWVTCDVNWNNTFGGTAWLKVKEINACGESAFTDSIAITVLPVPVVDLGTDTMLCLGDSVTLDAGNPGCSYLWSSGETTQTIQFFPDYTGEFPFWVIVTNPDGCSAYDDFVIWVSVCDGLRESDTPSVTVTPNPSGGKFLVSASHNARSYRVYNVVGSVIAEGNAGNSFVIDLSGKSEGLYLLVVEENGKRITARLILER